MLVTLLVFLLVLGLLVFVHELGHFLMAKRNGVKVEEFAFGFRPRLFAKTVGETTYALNLIPLGGYVKMFGEQDNQTGPRSFKSQSASSRLAILAAGSIMNLLLAWLILTFLFAAGFQPFVPNAAQNPFLIERPSVSIEKVIENTPAQASGIQTGDKIMAINGRELNDGADFIKQVRDLQGQATTFLVQRGDLRLEVVATPRTDPPPGQGALGVAVGQSGQVRSSLLQAPLAAAYETGRVIAISAVGFVGFLKNLVIKQEVSDEVTGLVGVGALTGVARRLGIDYLAQLVAMISIGLGVVNLMPILPLDGGHIAVLGYEKLARRPLSERQFSLLAGVGLALILLIFVVVTFKDLIRFDVWGRIF